MSNIAIRVENLGKLYRIGPRERYKTLRGTLTDALYASFCADSSTSMARFFGPDPIDPTDQLTEWTRYTQEPFLCEPHP